MIFTLHFVMMQNNLSKKPNCIHKFGDGKKLTLPALFPKTSLFLLSEHSPSKNIYFGYNPDKVSHAVKAIVRYILMSVYSNEATLSSVGLPRVSCGD